MADGGDLPDLENAQKNGKFGPDSYAFSSNILLVNKVKRKPIGGPQKTNVRGINLCRSEGERDLGLGSWTGDASWCREGGVATEDLLGGVTSCKESQ